MAHERFKSFNKVHTHQISLIFPIFKSFLKEFVRMIDKFLLSQKGKSAHVEPSLGEDVPPGGSDMTQPDVWVRGRDHNESVH